TDPASGGGGPQDRSHEQDIQWGEATDDPDQRAAVASPILAEIHADNSQRRNSELGGERPKLLRQIFGETQDPLAGRVLSGPNLSQAEIAHLLITSTLRST